MNKKKLKILVYIIIACLILVGFTALITFIISKIGNREFVKDLIIGLIIDGIILFLSFIVNCIRSLFKCLIDARVYNYSQKYNNKRIRLSFAYLIRIRVNNKYLLVKSGHDRNLYGPVGGVYHMNHTNYVYNELGFSRDETPGDNNDIRGTILGKNISKFIKWFNKGIDREVSPNREFFEELIESGVVPEALFKDLSFTFVGTKYRGVEYDNFYKIDELCRFDIFELVLNKEQEEFFSSLKRKGHVLLFTNDEINSGGVDKNNDRRIVGTQTVYILEDERL